MKTCLGSLVQGGPEMCRQMLGPCRKESKCQEIQGNKFDVSRNMKSFENIYPPPIPCQRIRKTPPSANIAVSAECGQLYIKIPKLVVVRFVHPDHSKLQQTMLYEWLMFTSIKQDHQFPGIFTIGTKCACLMQQSINFGKDVDQIILHRFLTGANKTYAPSVSGDILQNWRDSLDTLLISRKGVLGVKESENIIKRDGIACIISQSLIYNAIKGTSRAATSKDAVCYTKERETPSPIYQGLYGRGRTKQLIGIDHYQPWYLSILHLSQGGYHTCGMCSPC